ncbi:MAG TPA: hypothetical protein VLJ39_07700 [Tepidisphaeraceae bacterium]|nr:hypothetical protein [Tepidisphaeraceae bacterium]
MLALAIPLFGQQDYVARFDAYGGYAFLDSPHVNLFENGFAVQTGVRMRRWLSLGFDYSRSTGDLKLTPEMLLPSLQQSLGAQLGALAVAGRLPAGYSLTVPASSVTQTFAAGPQLAYRHLKHETLFLRPVFAGIIHEVATPKPGDAIATAIVAQLAPSGKKTDNVIFVGFGGGFDILFSRNVGWRTQADLVYDHLFNDMLKDGRFTVRFSTGPCFNFGKNVER